MPAYDFKSIPPILASKELIDAILYKTMRKTPTIVRKQFNIARIRNFYMLKVKFTQNTIDNKLQDIVGNFPKLEQIHPFYRYWFNVLYDRDHFKIALGQLKNCKTLVDKVGSHYVKLLKHADSLFQCKQLKVAALGRMVSLVRKMDAYLQYLEQVRQHMARLPNIDPSMRSIVITGYPSAGKSSFLNTLTAANVDVQSWAFTTQSLLVGHADRSNIRFQIIDTPGLLDRNLEERNNIELQAITALAYLNSTVIFVLDVTQGQIFTEKQVQLFDSLKPFFAGKNVVICLSKSDLWDAAQLSETEKQLIQSLTPFSFEETIGLAAIPYISTSDFAEALKIGGLQAVQATQALQQENSRIQQLISIPQIPMISCSSQSNSGCERVFNIAADLLLRQRERSGLQTYGQGQLAIPGLYVAYPKGKTSNSSVPDSVQQLNTQGLNPRPLSQADGFVTELDKEMQFGQSCKYIYNEREKWDLARPEWINDPIPLIHNGKNILDFITVDEDIMKMVQDLEEEERQLSKQPALYDDEELFKRLAAYKRLTDHSRPKNAVLETIRAKTNEKKAILERSSVRSGKARVTSITKQRNISATDIELNQQYKGVGEAGLEKAKKIYKKNRVSDSNQSVAPEEMARHLMSGKMSNGTRAWR
ncbi:Nucleolar GTP-binding protein 1 [Spironucleus salmonicida]|uniref:Nucleolar GTP-binding protein 1 n=1 Tax=Spironucleus salmonicida TaxID=348837 RepID=V6M061_9EUKA|nr:Nucleolar GTP-binding protein 1 [Spironucleus salmonicida]|eukprot:EST46514.1 Nucleolar GTP-binding protein 1 [Spironucleus salmonicida]